MIKEIKLHDKIIEYDLQRKSVKNINLRIRADGTIYVSANKWVSEEAIEKSILSKADFILKALNNCKSESEAVIRQYYTEEKLRQLIAELCEKIYPYFQSRIAFPEIKFRRMVSQWGNCRFRKGVLTFNTNLMYAPYECIEYVVAHEFTHFIEPNHSKRFYDELYKIMPDWKERREMLKKIQIR